jgi:hypothetical protein
VTLTTFANVAANISDVNRDQIARVIRRNDEQGKVFFEVTNARGERDLDGNMVVYTVRYNEAEDSAGRAFSCTCPAGYFGFRIAHPSGVCPHCRYVVAFVLHERWLLAESAELAQAAAAESGTYARQPAPPEEPKTDEEKYFDPANETSYFKGTRPDLFIVNGKEADDRTYARVKNAQPDPDYKPPKGNLNGNDGFNLLR